MDKDSALPPITELELRNNPFQVIQVPSLAVAAGGIFKESSNTRLLKLLVSPLFPNEEGGNMLLISLLLNLRITQ